MRQVLALVPLLLAALAGCVQITVGDPEPSAAPASPDDGLTTLEVQVTDAATGVALGGATLELRVPGLGSLRRTSGADGLIRITIEPAPSCSLLVERQGYQGGAATVDCTRDQAFRLPLKPLPAAGEDPALSDPIGSLDPLAPNLRRFSGRLLDTTTGAPVPQALLQLDPPTGATARTAADGNFTFLAEAGPHVLHVQAPCTAARDFEFDLDEDLHLDLHVVREGVSPAAPMGLRALPGPGPAHTALRWQNAPAPPQAPVTQHAVYRDGALHATIGATPAFAAVGGAATGHSYQVAAINVCGLEGPKSAAVQGTPLPGSLVQAGVTTASAPRAATRTYAVLDETGNPVGERAWRVVTGVGNCCETYVAADAAGKLYEYGGSTLFVSPDEGASWRQVSNVVPALNAEGAIVAAPGGDVLAVNWDPYSGDQLWSHKYVAATDTWYTARIPLHQPLYDRPWIAVIPGPFEVGGVVAPYVSLVMSNFVHGDLLLMSLDGLHYHVPTNRLLAPSTASIGLDLPQDPDRDWIHSIRETSVYPLANGHGLRARAILATCAQALLVPSLEWRCPAWQGVTQPPSRDEVLRVDSMGNLHVFTAQAGATDFSYRLSRDAGATWTHLTARLPGGLVIEDWDVQANALLDQAVVVVHASESREAGKNDQDLVFRFTDFANGPVLKEILAVGLGDHPFGGGLGSEYDRFDYTTVALLPSGHVALSFGDQEHSPPAIAIEL